MALRRDQLGDDSICAFAALSGALVTLAVSRVTTLSTHAVIDASSIFSLRAGLHRHPKCTARFKRVNTRCHTKSFAQCIELSHGLQID
jgi:hypothetical protein